MKPGVANFLLVLFSVLFAFVLVEGLLRVLPLPDLRVVSAFKNPPWQEWANSQWSDPGQEAYRSHPVLGYEHAPLVEMNVPVAEHANGAFRFRTNNLGLRRNSDTVAQKTSNLFRVLVLGDSQTDGYVDNEESFCQLLEQSLSTQLAPFGQRAEVLNAGVVGYSPAQEFLWYQQHGTELEPDLVLVIFYTGNDVVELRDPSKPTVDPIRGEAIPPAEEDSPRSVAGPGRFTTPSFLDNIQVIALVRYAIQIGPLAKPWRRLGLPGHLSEVGGFPVDKVIQVLRACHGCLWQNLRQAVYARRHPERSREDLRKVGDIFLRLNQDILGHGSRMAVTVLPSRARVEPLWANPELNKAAALFGMEEFDFAFEEEVSSTLVSHLASVQIPAILLKEPLIAATEIGPLYYNQDWHLTPLGHQIVANALEEALGDLGLLPFPVRPNG